MHLTLRGRLKTCRLYFFIIFHVVLLRNRENMFCRNTDGPLLLNEHHRPAIRQEFEVEPPRFKNS